MLLSWAFEGLGTTTRALNVLRNALESDRLELAQAAGLLEGYLSDDNADVIDCYLAWLVPDGKRAKDRPVEALRRARRLLSSDGSRTLVRELCRGVLESYPKNEAALPILQESCDDTAGVDFLVNTLRTVLSRSQTTRIGCVTLTRSLMH